MTECEKTTRRRTLQDAGILAAATLVALLPDAPAHGHEGHDHAPRTLLDLKGKLVRIVGPGDPLGDAFVQDRVTIRADGQGRIIDLRYG
jgi:hypothetical protein